MEDNLMEDINNIIENFSLLTEADVETSVDKMMSKINALAPKLKVDKAKIKELKKHKDFNKIHASIKKALTSNDPPKSLQNVLEKEWNVPSSVALYISIFVAILIFAAGRSYTTGVVELLKTNKFTTLGVPSTLAMFLTYLVLLFTEVGPVFVARIFDKQKRTLNELKTLVDKYEKEDLGSSLKYGQIILLFLNISFFAAHAGIAGIPMISFLVISGIRVAYRMYLSHSIHKREIVSPASVELADILVEHHIRLVTEDSKYQQMFSKMLDKFGVKKLEDLPDDKKKELFNQVDASWKAKKEAD